MRTSSLILAAVLGPTSLSDLAKGGHWSRVGNFTTDHESQYQRRTSEEFTHSIVHEFGHDLGMVHEHQSPASDILWDEQKMYDYCRNVVAIIGIARLLAVDSDVLCRYDGTNMNFSEFDPDLIMMYEVPGSVTKGSASIRGQGCKLSEKDKWFVLYSRIVNMLTAIPRQSPETISTGQKYIIKNIKYKKRGIP
jgi:hypothetical protein